MTDTIHFRVKLYLAATALLINPSATTAQSIPDLTILAVENTGRDTSEAWLVGTSNNGLLSYNWNDQIKLTIQNEPFIMYHKGNRIGSFYTTRIVEDELGIWFDGISHFDKGIDPLCLDSLGQCSFIAVPANRQLGRQCAQPTGYDPQDFPLEFDCDGKTDSLQTNVTGSLGTIDLRRGNGTIEHIDSVLNNDRLESIWIQDIIDLDSDGVPEVLATFNTYPTYSYVIYKRTIGVWKRILYTRGLGD